MNPPASRTLPALLDEMARRQPGHELLVGEDGQRLGYAETRERARQLARGLLDLGVARGDRVALLMDNRPEWLLVAFAVTMVGATLVPISTWSRPRELEFVLGHCGASALVTVPALGGQDYLGAVLQAGPRLAQLRRVVVAGGAAPDGLLELAAVAMRGARVPESALDAAERALAPEDVAFILYTSGTTSTPKGVQLCHGRLVENPWSIGERQRLTSADRVWMGI